MGLGAGRDGESGAEKGSFDFVCLEGGLEIMIFLTFVPEKELERLCVRMGGIVAYLYQTSLFAWGRRSKWQPDYPDEVMSGKI